MWSIWGIKVTYNVTFLIKTHGYINIFLYLCNINQELNVKR